MVSAVTTDRDYLEIVKNDNSLVSATSIGGDTDGISPQTVVSYGATTYSGSSTVTHSLGSVPIVRAFYDSDKNGRLYNTTRWTSGFNYMQTVDSAPQLLTLSTTNTTKLIIANANSISDVPVYYRIYKFGTKGFTTDSSIDKIFHKDTDSATVSAAAFSDQPVASTNTLPHGQAEKIFWTLEYSVDQTNWYRGGSLLFGSPDTTSGPAGGPYSFYYYVTAYGSADATNFYVTYVHNYPTSKTIYTRFVWDYIN